jgi:fibronectin type 3 domain-containing protein
MAACGGESQPAGSDSVPVAVDGNTNSTSTAPVTTNNNSATLQWDAVKSADLGMYRVYFGTAPGSYFQSPGQGIPVGNVTTYTVTGLSRGTRYYFRVTAVDRSGNESPYSNEVFKDIA